MTKEKLPTTIEECAAEREYKSLFGVPPIRQVQRLRESAAQSVD